MNYIPIGKIGTSYGNLATLGSDGRFDKARLPDDLVYTSDFHTSRGSDGYTTNPDGIIIQWGFVDRWNAGPGHIYVSFPRYFSRVFSVNATYLHNSRGDKVADCRGVAEVSTSGFCCPVDGGKGTYWMAIGC